MADKWELTIREGRSVTVRLGPDKPSTDEISLRLYGEDGDAETIAVMRQITALPELLTALREIAAGMGNLPLDEMGPDGVHGINDGKQRAIYLERFVRAAREAIAKV